MPFFCFAFRDDEHPRGGERERHSLRVVVSMTNKVYCLPLLFDVWFLCGRGTNCRYELTAEIILKISLMKECMRTYIQITTF